MLPLQLVEKAGFRDFMHFLEPSFRLPTRQKLKTTIQITNINAHSHFGNQMK